MIFENKDKIYSIQEVSELANIHPQTIRNWEKYGLITPQRINGSQRIFSKKELERIELILELKNQGFNVVGIKHMIDSQSTEQTT